MLFKKRIHDQLPVFQPWTVERLLAIVGSLAGIIALIITFLKLDRLNDDVQTFILLVEISLLCVGLLIYLYVTSRKKLHRYAQATFFVHYVNHIIRDQIASLEAGKKSDLKELLQDIVDAVANCYSILTARRCRCCIQEITPQRNVVTIVRDSITSTQSANTDSKPHNIEANTDFESIWYGRDGCPRYFISRNLVKLWRTNQYRNSSFQVYGQPKTMSFLGMTFVTRWTLPYKATIVWPIRYVPEEARWPTLNLDSLPSDKRPFVWGFLCVDSGARNSFESIYGPELGAAFADVIFSLLHAARIIAEPRSLLVDSTGVNSRKALSGPQ
jgi:hypothetical protein